MKNLLEIGFKKKCYITPDKIILSIEPPFESDFKGSIQRGIDKNNVRTVDLLEFESKGYELLKTPF